MDRTQTPGDLPEPSDDGACDHLPGASVPDLALPDTDGRPVDLARLPLSVLYIYPMTGRPGQPLPRGWDSIPGARGCTPQACAFRDHQAELAGLGARVYGLSTQRSADQAEARQRLHLPFALLSDAECRLAERLGLPTFSVDGAVFYRRLTLIVEAGRVLTCFYPVFPPEQNAGEVIEWLSHHR